jgi:hypothetical protein
MLLNEASDGRMAFVQEGQRDRSHSTRYRLLMASLARSAWESPPKEPSRRVRLTCGCAHFDSVIAVLQ